MKKLIFAISFAFIGMLAMNAQEIKFEKELIDYGEIKQGADGNRVFKFKNTGNKPLLIQDVTTTCGCTIPEYPKTAIAPGATGEIKVHYDTKRLNSFSKTITVMSNAVETGRVILRIKGKVLGEDI